MSIIIAKKIGDTCIYNSDTKVSIDSGDNTVTGNNKIRFLPEEGVLKIHILFQSICIAFAGTIEICIDILHQLCNYQPRDIYVILKYLQEGLIEQNDNSEFIASFSTQEKIRLFKIDNKSIEEGESFWIGDKNAFNEFQQQYLTQNKDTNFSSAFVNMISNTEIPTIGDFVVSSYYNNKIKSFVYEEGIEVRGGYSPLHLKANTPTVLNEGSTNEGAFTVSRLVSNRTGNPAVCLYFGKGKLGFLYFPISNINKIANPIVLKNVSIKELKQTVLDKYQIELIGFDIDNGLINLV